jgi:hypothetical protein
MCALRQILLERLMKLNVMAGTVVEMKYVKKSIHNFNAKT